MGNKRRRIALSCVDCRRRKVKCDRTYPICIRCEKGGYGDQCTYVTHTSDPQPAALPTPEDDELTRRHQRESSWAEEATDWEATARITAAAQKQPASRPTPSQAPATSKPTPKHAEQRLATLQGRLKDLETHVYSAGPRRISHEKGFFIADPLGPGAERELATIGDKYVLAESDKVLLRGKSFRTKYFGPSHSLSTLLQFEELSRFVKDMLVAMPSLSHAKISMAKIREASKRGEKAAYDLAIENLSSMVPERTFADRLVSQYFEAFETTYRILHVPSFLQEYEAFWQNPNEASPDFVVRLLLVMATVYCVVSGGQEGYLGRSSVRRETATHWVNVCQHWLDKHSQKHVDLAYFQVHVLIWLARKMNCLKIKREWTNIGSVSRLLMAAGFHREPTMVSKRIDVFDCEMRRRLWYTVVELDLQTALDRGMSPTFSARDWDVFPPRNIDDESFNIESEELPESKDRNHFTRSSFLALQSESLPIRIEALQKINSIRGQMDLDTIMVYDDKFRSIIDDLPVDEWKEPSTANTNMATPATTSSAPRTPGRMTTIHMTTASPTLASALSKLIPSEYIAVLHQPVATMGPPKQRNFFSRAARRDASTTCLNIYTRVLEESQRRVYAQFREDDIRAILAISHDLATSSSFQENRTAVDLLQETVNMLGDRVASLGQGFHSYWIVSSALSFVHSKQSPQVPTSTFAQAAVDRIIRLHDAVIKGQIPQARQLMPADTNYDGWGAAGGTKRSAEALSNPATSVAAARGSQASPLDTSAHSFAAPHGANQQQQQEQMAPNQVTGLDVAQTTQGMDFLGGGFDQVDAFGGAMFAVDDFDWTNVWSIDPFSSWPANVAAGGNTSANGDGGYFGMQ